MTICKTALCVAILTASFAARRAAAETTTPWTPAAGAGMQTEEQFLVGLVSPRLAARALWANGFGGYDGARESAVVGAAAELALTRWLGLRAGFYFVPSGRDNDNLRPNVGLRAQLLHQEAAGVDGSVALNYRQERYVEDGGLLEAVLSVGRSGDSFSSFVNLAYAQDPEGDDFEGEARAAALYRLRPGFNLGLQGSYRRDLGSTDQRRATRVQPDYNLTAGAVTTLAAGGLVFLLEAGVNAFEQAGTQLSERGLFGVAGVGASF